MKETELAKRVIAWLDGWEVYQEVQINEAVADIVAVCGNLTWIVETKTTASLSVLEQALHRKKFANYVSVAIPSPKRYGVGRGAFDRFCKQNGIGIIQVSMYGSSNCHTIIEPVMTRLPFFKLKNRLCEKQKTYAEAGNSNGSRWTPFKQTCENLKRIVKKNPGIHFKELIDSLDHHYASKGTAKACISKYLQMDNVIEGVVIKKEGKYLRIYPA